MSEDQRFERMCVKVFSLSSSGGVSAVFLCLYSGRRGTDRPFTFSFFSLESTWNKGPKVILCVWLTVGRFRLATRTATRYIGYTLLSINMICLLFLSHPPPLRFCQLWPLMCSAWCVCVRNSCQGTPCLVFPSSLPLLTHCQQVSCYSAWTQPLFQTMQMFCSPVTFLWHFCGSGREFVISWRETYFGY